MERRSFIAAGAAAITGLFGTEVGAAQAATPRRVFYVEVGDLPPETAKQFIKSFMEKYDGTP